jgi:hypothetical protein
VQELRRSLEIVVVVNLEHDSVVRVASVEPGGRAVSEGKNAIRVIKISPEPISGMIVLRLMSVMFEFDERLDPADLMSSSAPA